MYTILDEIYILKKRILQLERLRRTLEFSEELFKNYRSLTAEANTLDELRAQILEFKTEYIEYYIPEEVIELWDSGDYEVYTDCMHHRKMWNDIDNDSSVDYFVERFCSLLGLDTSESDKHQYLISLYDFNNFDIYFNTQEDIEKFIEEQLPDCYVAFSRNSDGWEEAWTD